LKDKVVFVSGGTGYLGSAICRVFHQYGARVLFSYNRNEKEAISLSESMPGSTPVCIDFANVSQMKQTIEKLYGSHSVIDILVNNAAVAQIMPLPLIEEEDVDHVMDINIKGNLFLTKYIVKGMIRNKKGSIVNLSSIAGVRILDVPVTYAMTKAAMNGMTVALAGELKRFGIRVNSVIPGLLEGGVGDGVPEALKKDFVEHCTLGRAGKAEEVAEVICFLAGDKASYVNGQSICVDGGI